MATLDRLTLYERIRDKVAQFCQKSTSSRRQRHGGLSTSLTGVLRIEDIVNVFSRVLGEDVVCTLILKGLFQQIHYIPKLTLQKVDKCLQSRITAAKEKIEKQRVSVGEIAEEESATVSSHSGALLRVSKSSAARDSFPLLPTQLSVRSQSWPTAEKGTGGDLFSDDMALTFSHVSVAAPSAHTPEAATDAVEEKQMRTPVSEATRRIFENPSLVGLSRDVLTGIFSYLDISSSVKCERVCVYFSSILSGVMADRRQATDEAPDFLDDVLLWFGGEKASGGGHRRRGGLRLRSVVSTNNLSCFSHFKYEFGRSSDLHFESSALGAGYDYMFDHFSRLNSVTDPFRRYRHVTACELRFFKRHDRESRLLKGIGCSLRNVESLLVVITPQRCDTLVYLDWLSKKNSKFFNCLRQLSLVMPSPLSRAYYAPPSTLTATGAAMASAAQTSDEALSGGLSRRLAAAATVFGPAHAISSLWQKSLNSLSTYRNQLPVVLRQCSFLRTLNLNTSLLGTLYRNIKSNCLELTQIRSVKDGFVAETNDLDFRSISNVVLFNRNTCLVQYGRHVRYSLLSYFGSTVEAIHVHGHHAFYDDMLSEDIALMRISNSFVRFPLLKEVCVVVTGDPVTCDSASVPLSSATSGNSKVLLGFFRTHLLYAPKLTHLSVCFPFVKVDCGALQSLLRHFVGVDTSNTWMLERMKGEVSEDDDIGLETDTSEDDADADDYEDVKSDDTDDTSARLSRRDSRKKYSFAARGSGVRVKHLSLFFVGIAARNVVSVIELIEDYMDALCASDEYNAVHCALLCDETTNFRCILDRLHLHLDVVYSNLDEIKTLLDLLKSSRLFQSDTCSYVVKARKSQQCSESGAEEDLIDVVSERRKPTLFLPICVMCPTRAQPIHPIYSCESYLLWQQMCAGKHIATDFEALKLQPMAAQRLECASEESVGVSRDGVRVASGAQWVRALATARHKCTCVAEDWQCARLCAEHQFSSYCVGIETVKQALTSRSLRGGGRPLVRDKADSGKPVAGETPTATSKKMTFAAVRSQLTRLSSWKSREKCKADSVTHTPEATALSFGKKHHFEFTKSAKCSVSVFDCVSAKCPCRFLLDAHNYEN